MNNYDSVILERIDELINNKLYFILTYTTKFTLTYENIEQVWDDFVIRKYGEIVKRKTIVNMNNNSDLTSLKIAIGDSQLSSLLEELFMYHIKCNREDLIFFYFKGTDKILVKLKSFSPLVFKDGFGLPFWSLYLKDKKIQEKMSNNLKTDENLVIFCYS